STLRRSRRRRRCSRLLPAGAPMPGPYARASQGSTRSRADRISAAAAPATGARIPNTLPCTRTAPPRARRLRAVGGSSGSCGAERGAGGAIAQFRLGLEAFDRGLLTHLRSSRGISRGIGFAAVRARRRGLVRGPLPTLGLADRGVLFDEGLPHDPPRVVLARIELLPVHVLEVVSEVTLDAVLRAFGHPSHLTDEITQLLCVFGQALGSDHDQGHNDQDHH